MDTTFKINMQTFHYNYYYLLLIHSLKKLVAQTMIRMRMVGRQVVSISFRILRFSTKTPCIPKHLFLSLVQEDDIMMNLDGWQEQVFSISFKFMCFSIIQTTCIQPVLDFNFRIGRRLFNMLFEIDGMTVGCEYFV